MKVFLLRREAQVGEDCDIIVLAPNEKTAIMLARKSSNDFIIGDIKAYEIEVNIPKVIYVAALIH